MFIILQSLIWERPAFWALLRYLKWRAVFCTKHQNNTWKVYLWRARKKCSIYNHISLWHRWKELSHKIIDAFPHSITKRHQSLSIHGSALRTECNRSLIDSTPSLLEASTSMCVKRSWAFLSLKHLREPLNKRCNTVFNESAIWKTYYSIT